MIWFNCLLFFALLQVGVPSQIYQIYNFTWIIKNQAGDIVNSSTSVGAHPHWPVIEVDLCKLALGASSDWGTPSSYLPQSRPVNSPDPTYDGHLGGCNSYIKRASLAEDMSGLYVCPGTHRDRSLNYKCGYASDFYCASWGCETTGDAWWKPSSSWDYITVRRKYLPTYLQDKLGIKTETPKKTLCQNDWCIPLLINFTMQGRTKDWTGRGYEWGLRLKECDAITIGCHDPGLLMRVHLSKTLPTQTSVAVGPNPALGGEPTRKRTNTDSMTILASTTYVPTLPPPRPSSTEVILTLVNATIEAIHNTSSPSYEECWVCFSPVPPLYEGVAVFGKPQYTTTAPYPAHPHEQGLTLSLVSGLGTCLTSPGVQPPVKIKPICNQTFEANSTGYTLAPNNTYFACSTGLTTFVVNQEFIKLKDYCILVILLPRLTVHDPDSFLRFYETGISVSKREPITAITLSVILGLAAAGAGTGIASLVTSHHHFSQLQAAIDKDLGELQEGIQNLKDSVASLSEVVLQNRRGLDLLFLKEGGLCVALKEECCFYSDKTGLTQNSLNKVRKSLEERKRLREQQEAWYKNWFASSPWLSTLLPTILGPVVGLLLLVSFGPWAFNRLTRFVKSQIDSALKPAEVHYHRLAADEELAVEEMPSAVYDQPPKDSPSSPQPSLHFPLNFRTSPSLGLRWKF